MNEFLIEFPYKLNAITSTGVLLFVAFVPHLFRRVIVTEKIKSMNKTMSIANSRFFVNLATDDTAAGQQIARLTGCHQNSLEAFTFFGIALALCISTGTSKSLLDGASTVFLITRIVYIFVYMSEFNGILRSIVWTFGMYIIGVMYYNAAVNYEKVL